MAGKKSSQAIDARILATIKGRGRGCVFVPAEFYAIGSRQAVDLTLHRLWRAGVIRRLAWGVYDYPKEHPVLGLLTPSAETIAKALAGRDKTRLQSSGVQAANTLGLSDQVPAKVVFLTDGTSRTVRIGTMTIQLRKTTPKNMATAGRLSGLVIQAFKALGREHVTKERVDHLKRILPLEKRRTLLDDLGFAPAWMRSLFIELAEVNL
jgi:Family of unknown function (DUF6088)